ncbi:MAG TPA: manganese efflux pump MntP [Bacteroidales bacterium]|nr:manganese efflux pump MntP [Bacteroidales bacterium]
MDFLVIIGIATALSMDALAVSVANGIMIKQLRTRHAVRIAFSFGFFQAIMPLIGWAAGITFSQYIKPVDHWIAFGLLLLVGGRMIWESISNSKKDEAVRNCLHFPTLLILSIATSIDALAVGVSFAFLDITIWLPIVLIGLITFVICFVGIIIGNKLGPILGNKLGIIGGVTLILIGVKILIEHLSNNL